MKKKLTHLLLIAFAAVFTSCSSNNDDDKAAEKIAVTLQEKYETSTFSVLNIPASAEVASPVYEWILTKNPVNQTTDSIVGNTKDLRFVPIYAGAYELTLNVTSGDKKGSKKTIVNVTNETKNYNPYITSIFDFDPAPGMFANDVYKDGFKKEDVVRTALGRINETNVGYQLDLGGFGGSIIVGFDHTVVNVSGQNDFKIYGGDLTDKANPPAPGIIYVAYDKNGNGKPDEDEWYEIIGSQHTKANTIKNFKITYHKKAVGVPVVVSGPNDMFSDREHIFCENNSPETYYMPKSKSKKEYYPL